MTRSMPPLIEAFLEMIAAERGASKNTLDAYARDLAGYGAGLAHAGKTPQDAATGDIRAYLSLLAKRGLKPASSARKLSSIRQFHRFLVADGRRSDDPALIVESPRRGRRLPKTLSAAEVDHLLAVSKEGLDDEARPRARTVACVAYGLPARTSLCDGAAGFRTRFLVVERGANDSAFHLHSRQRRARTAGAATQRGAADDCGLPRFSKEN